MLSVIQDQAWALWNDFLEPEFGFNEDHLQVTFSGHRGFHLHYRDPSLFHLDSEARRELVSHIAAKALTCKVVLQGTTTSTPKVGLSVSARAWTP